LQIRLAGGFRGMGAEQRQPSANGSMISDYPQAKRIDAIWKCCGGNRRMLQDRVLRQWQICFTLSG